jgi:hypothetical protein
MSIAHARTPQLGIYSAVAELKQVIRASRYLDRATNTTMRRTEIEVITMPGNALARPSWRTSLYDLSDRTS